ncbi:thyrotropin-releasing hormone receptor-like [Patella vulgata]|uniref:thyrotropin-releasing hormone receptor-like n=1 Tax=Patella vulgata TaxID=6465 RepID=UPI0021803A21|nr:thyrotropin-releasing hormone receptor-like [Patella vulgata]
MFLNMTEADCLHDGVRDVLKVLHDNITFNASHCPQVLQPKLLTHSQYFYSYFTPVILLVGLTGNILSLRVFLSKNMRKLSASTYLAALSTSDILALIFYVFVDWLKRGLPAFNADFKVMFLETDVVCQAILYLSYLSRFLSAWFIVSFTAERYIGVCLPLRRKDICGKRFSQKIICTLVVCSGCIMMYKPLLSGVYEINHTKVKMCTRDPELSFPVFILDSIFAVMITFIPFIIITVLNTLIMRKLFLRNKKHRSIKIITEESIIKLEFTIILLVISFVFIALNLPFFCVWCKQFLLSISASMNKHAHDFDNMQGLLLITRVIFYLNYCINFFLYSITGAYFRKELKILFFYKSPDVKDYRRCSHYTTTPNSWV